MLYGRVLAGRQCDGSPFPVRTTAGGEARADQDQLELSGIASEQHERGIHVV